MMLLCVITQETLHVVLW